MSGLEIAVSDVAAAITTSVEKPRRPRRDSMSPGAPTKSIAMEIAHMRTLDGAALVTRYETLFGQPPRSKNRDRLWRRCAWKLQEQRFGGLSGAATKKLAELMSEIELPVEVRERIPVKSSTPQVGSVLVREWRNQKIEVRVVEHGFEWNGAPYRSLSAIAKAITGCAWNGKLFFGLVERKRR